MVDPSSGMTFLMPEATASKMVERKGWIFDVSERARKRHGIRTGAPSEALDDPVAAVKMGLLRGATMRLVDPAIRAAGGEEAARALTKMEQENPWAMGGGEVLGTALSMGAGPLKAVGQGAAAVGSRATARLGGGAAARVTGRIAEGAAAGGVYSGAHGASEVALKEGPIDWVEGMKHIGKRALGGGVTGGAIGVTFHGLGALAKYGARKARDLKVSKAAQVSTMEEGQRRITEELSALQAMTSPTGAQIAKIARLEGRLTQVAGKLDQARRPMAQKLFEEYAEGKASRLMAGVGGGVIGGLPGAAVGTLLGPAVTGLVRKAVAPVTSRMGTTVEAMRTVQRAAARTGEAAPEVGKVVSRGVSAMNPTEFSKVAQELETASPAAMELRMFSAMPDNLMSGEDRAALIQQEVSRVTFLQGKLPVTPMTEAGQVMIPFTKQLDPGIEARTEFTRYVKAAMDPESVIEHLRDGVSTPEEWETMRTLMPDEYEEIRQVIQQELRLKLVQGETYDVAQEGQIALALNQPSAFAGLGPLIAPEDEEKPQEQGVKAPKGLDAQQMSSLQQLMSRRNKS